MEVMRKPTLSDPAVQAAKARYDDPGDPRGRNMKKGRPSFETYLDAFCEMETSFTEIGKRFNLSTERIRQIYNTWFRMLFENTSGRKRLRVGAMLKGERYAQKTTRENPHVARIFEMARHAGCEIDVVTVINNEVTIIGLKKIVLINGHRCQIHFSKKASTTGLLTYARCTLSRNKLRKTDAVIFLINIPGYAEQIFVIPCAVILATHFSDTQTAKILHIPLEKRSHLFCPPKLNYFDFKNAWHLLTPKPVPAPEDSPLS